MHAMALSVMVLGVAAAVFAIGAFADPEVVPNRRVWRRLAGGSSILGLSMLMLLSYAPRLVCIGLDGRWTERSSCVHEWGGNGDHDDPNSLIFF